MPRAPIYKDPLDGKLPRMRCTKQMERAVSQAAEVHNVSVAEVVRACIAHSLRMQGGNSELVIRMFRKASSLEPDGNNEGT